MSVLVFAVVLTVKIFLSDGYNFDTKFPEVFSSDNKNAYFGFSVFLQKGTPSNVIVGAVKGNSTFVPYSGNSPGVVYKCLLSDSKTCFEYRLGHEVSPDLNFNAKMDNELLGAAIDGGQIVGEPIIVCAPRLMRQQLKSYNMNGACFILNNSTLTTKQAETFIPLSDLLYQTFDNSYFYGIGEAGMSLHFLQEYSQILIGAPVVFRGRGTLIRYQLREPYQPYLKSADQIEKVSIPNPYYYNAKLEYHSYLGYSSSYGIFDENRGLWYVAGAPRDSLMKGKILLFSYPNYIYESIIIHNEFVGDQMGSYYGFSLIAFKNSNDTGICDLLVGAPMFSLKGYDEGCVYYYKNDGRAQFREPIKIFGDTTSGSRFGYAIANLGDINHDSYTDIAISAPYEFKEGGAVYIFLGRHDGLSNKFSQKITGRSINQDVVALGLSLSRGLDIDQNSFNDLAIGDFKSGRVVVIKTKPVIKYFGNLGSEIAELGVAENIRFNLTFCLWYDSPNGIVKSVKTVLYYYPDPRVVMKNSVRTVTLELNNIHCQNLTLTLTNNTISSFTTPVHFKINYELNNQSNTEFCKTCPITDPSETNSVYLELPLVSGCKNTTVCFPDLNVSAKFIPNLNYLVLGKDSVLNMNVEVTNSQEPAYLCQLLLKIPNNVEMRRIPNKCTQTKNGLHCLLKSVLYKNNVTQIEFEFDLTKLTYLQKGKLNFYVEVASSGDDKNEDNNKINLDLPLKLESLVQINGESQPDQLTYKDTINLSHKYSFVNLGPSSLPRLNFLINFPFEIRTEEFVSEFSLQNTIDGGEVECDEMSQHSPVKVSLANKTFANFPPDQILFINCTEGGLITCKQLNCHVNQEFKKDQIVRLDFMLKIDVDTIRKKHLEHKRIIVLQTDVISSYSNGAITSVKTIVMTSITEVSYKVYIVGVLIGVIILSGIVFLLYKLKFFQRPLMERLENSEEISSEVGDDFGKTD